MSNDNDLIPIYPDACRILGNISKATYWRGAKDGRFPKPIKLGPFISRVPRRELDACVERLKAAR